MLRGLFDFFGLARPRRAQRMWSARRPVNTKAAVKRKLARAGSEPLGDPADWPAAYREQLRRICADAAADLGYRI